MKIILIRKIALKKSGVFSEVPLSKLARNKLGTTLSAGRVVTNFMQLLYSVKGSKMMLSRIRKLPPSRKKTSC